MKCMWCDAEPIRESVKDCYWVAPDGKTAVQILEAPALDCPNCGQYVTENMSQRIEEALYLNDFSALGSKFRYEELMNAPRINKFSSKG
ncbi:uncharacterized protein, YokU family [Paenibacillus tianmuensis]|uniref:Uncharacterized protein, YokU family n=1 Tax=Paenibacillus tianmuensis TaxID=624147 RepID=A0A1G4SPK8_9BACL|nr:YokU family protein [Paenibacillus tianmuensis]SCW71120.1 uncharacterized protein, YokU family [Paenibacillus tianmuensis]